MRKVVDTNFLKSAKLKELYCFDRTRSSRQKRGLYDVTDAMRDTRQTRGGTDIHSPHCAC